jgi:hypothetical protein
MSNMNWGRFGFTIGGYILGYLVGSLFGAPMLGAALGGIVGGIVGPLVFPNDPLRIEGPRLQNLVQTSEYGWPIPILFGHNRLGGCVAWASPRQEHRKEESEGGKGGGDQEVIYGSYYYTQSFAVKICRGPVSKLFRIWADNKLIYDCKPENDGPVIGQDLHVTFYSGTEDQMPDPIIESYKGIGNVTAFRGDCYIVFEDMDITEYGGRIPNLNFEAATQSEDSYPEIEVDLTGIMTGATIMRMSPTGEYAVLYNTGKFITVDLLSNRVLAIKDFGADCVNFQQIDDEGNIYTMLKDEQFAYYPICLDRNLNIVRQGDKISDMFFLDTAVASDNIYYFIAGYEPSGYYGQTYEVRLLQKRLLITELSELWRWPICVSDWGTGGRITGICIDKYYSCWVLIYYENQYQATGLTQLIRLIPFIDIKLTYTITLQGSGVWPNAVGYDPITGYIVLTNGSSTIWIWNPDTASIVKQFGPASVDGHNYAVDINKLRDIKDNLLWAIKDGTDYIAINLATLKEVRNYAVSNWSGGINWTSGVLYDKICNALWPAPVTVGADKIFYKLPLDRATRTSVLLGSDIVQALCEEVGLTAADLDLTEITADGVRGYCISQQMTVRRAIEPLQQAFFWDCAEIDGKITAVKRGGASVVTITEADLAAVEEGQDRPDELPIIRAQEVELPRVLNIAYTDIDQAYQPGNQRSIRQTTDSVGEQTITLPLVLTATEAKRIAETLHQIAWLERNRYAPVFLPPKYLYLTPTDVITVERGGNTYLLHIQKIDLGANYLMQFEAIPEDAAIYDSYAIGEHGEHVPPQVIDYPGSTEFYLIDTPYIRDSEYHASPYGFYIAACGRLAAWRGAQLFRSLDEGISYQVIQALLNGAVMGIASTALGEPGDPWTWDNHQVTIQLLDEEVELASASKTNVLNGQNAFLLGHPDKGWELCAFTEAALNEDGTYTLGTLLRALRGTEWMCGEHLAGDIFILLSTTNIYRLIDQASDLDKERLYKAISLGMPFSSATQRTFTNTGRGIHPYAPQHIRGSRDGSNNLTATWVRRARVDGEWRDLVETPLEEAAEAYEVDIIKAGVVKRTIGSLTSPTCAYTAAQQTTDGFTPGDPIPLAVYQLSAVIGRGFGGEATI